MTRRKVVILLNIMLSSIFILVAIHTTDMHKADNVEDKVYFDTYIKPIFAEKCSLCHKNFPGKNWEEYEDAVRNKTTIRIRIFIRKDMPPEYATQLDLDELSMIKLWLNR